MHPLVDLAKKAVENYVKNGKVIEPPAGLPEECLKKKAGTFVTIEKNNDLRGCIGTYLPTEENIAQEVISNAIAAATRDDRFGPIQKEELPLLSYTVYVLNKPEIVKDLKELNPKKYGVIVQSGFKSGLLLPDLEGVNTIKEQLFIACQKAGIDPTVEPVTVYKFSTKKYS